jgi:hypothetical protein
LIELISAYTGMGSGRPAALAKDAAIASRNCARCSAVVDRKSANAAAAAEHAASTWDWSPYG